MMQIETECGDASPYDISAYGELQIPMAAQKLLIVAVND
jgi:hypothetical protein